jgi:hypothetical protein
MELGPAKLNHGLEECMQRFSSIGRTGLLSMLLLIAGCMKYVPPDSFSQAFLERVETQEEGPVRVSAVVLSASESEKVFGSSLPDMSIQPVWLKIHNQTEEELVLQLLSIDPDYFAPSEAAWLSRGFGERGVAAKMHYFYEQHIPLLIPAGVTTAGFVFTHFDPGVKAFAVQLLGERKTYDFDFVLPVPGFQADFMKRDTTKLYAPDEIRTLNLDELRDYLTHLPCCVLGGDQQTDGDPLNLVIVGQGRHGVVTLARRGWDLTETLSTGTAWRTAVSSIFGSRYRTSPLSPLYLFGRSQDASFQKARETVDERNHLRLWRAPVNFQGMPVWVGQISRDIGVKLSGKTIVTHKIDPVVDEARTYIGLDLLASQYLGQVGYVRGVGVSTRAEPRYNYTDDPYYTDGLRVVLFLSEAPVAYDEINWLDWERPPGRLTITEEGPQGIPAAR